MSIRYRFSRKELILLLDLEGDAGSLEQKFGDVYISSAEYDSISEKLHGKGFVTVTGNTVSAEAGISFLMKKIYSSPLALRDSEYENWIYCSENIIVTLRAGSTLGFEYVAGAVTDDEDRAELSEKISGRRFSIIRGGHGEINGEDLVSFAGKYTYEK
ncbi:MAG: hypothetical protein MJ095_05275 [Oscillospiraceae bacterium]|nr:hypothetical protein [Oscillospiraceae bacterium]